MAWPTWVRISCARLEVRNFAHFQASWGYFVLLRITKPPTPYSVTWAFQRGKYWMSKSENPALVIWSTGQRPPPAMAILPAAMRE